MLTALFQKVWGYVIGVGALLAAALTAWGIAKRSGEKQEQSAETERSLKEAKESNEIDTKVRAMSDAELDEQLRSVRPPPPK